MSVKVIPDQEFLTKNTCELKAMLEAIPEEALNYNEDTFEKDIKRVLGSKDTARISEDMTSFKFDKCNFRASPEICLRAHNTFVHGDKFSNCPHCPMRTRTECEIILMLENRYSKWILTLC